LQKDLKNNVANKTDSNLSNQGDLKKINQTHQKFYSSTGVARNFDWEGAKWKNFVTLFWWRHLADLMAMTSQK